LAIYYVESIDEVTQIAENARLAIEQLNIQHSANLPYKIVTTSIGIAVYQGEPDLTSDRLYNYADKALYQAKNSGKNKLVIADY